MKFDTLEVDSLVLPQAFTVPESHCWHLLFGHAIFETSAVGGNRRLLVEVTDEDGHIVSDMHAGAKQGSSSINQYALKQGIGRAATFVDNDIELAMPVHCIMLPGWTLTVLTSEIQDPIGDLITFHMVIRDGSVGEMVRELT